MKRLLVALAWARDLILAALALFGFGWLWYARKHGDDAPDVGTPNQDRVRGAIERNDLDALKDEVLK